VIELKIKHKPILLKKLEIENELKNKEAESGPPREESYYINHADANSIYGTVIIGVTGTSHGIGCTSVSIAIAHYLTQHFKNIKVAYFELNDSYDIQLLNDNYPKALTEDSFRFNYIDFYTNRNNLVEIINTQTYKFIVLDIGVLKSLKNNKEIIENKNLHEFIRSDLKVLVTGSTPWLLDKTLTCLFEDRIKGIRSNLPVSVKQNKTPC